jgi:hypothetical protein
MSGRDQPRAGSDGHETDDWHRNYGGAEADAF